MGVRNFLFSSLIFHFGVSYVSGCGSCFDPAIIPGKNLVATAFGSIDVESWDGTTNPFAAAPNDVSISGGDCYVVVEANGIDYSLVTSVGAPSGGILTHYGPCGHCSSLTDLQVYLDYANDPSKSLRGDVQNCALLETLLGWTMLPFALAENCIMNLGFTPKCSSIWAYNSDESSQNCFTDCFFPNYNLGDKPANEPEPNGLLAKFWFYLKLSNYNPCDPSKCSKQINGGDACTPGSYSGQTRLNECLQCDECKQGGIFKKYAGRTRRNSGIQDEIQRDPSEIADICYSPVC
mmetsp:Transcript_3890/g.4547  ORF Transcript_3890/g.4547 Transcript_3890/m.4547 type:complete len:292 (+) Transcript_3890:149-1024(+)